MYLVKFADVGRALTAAEVDSNWAAIQEAVALGGGAIRSIVTTADGMIQFVGDDDLVIASVPLPPPFVVSGPWLPGTPYSERHIVTRSGAAHLCSEAHVSGQDFEADLANGRWHSFGGAAPDAAGVAYTPEEYSLTAGTENVQDAIDALAESLVYTQATITNGEYDIILRVMGVEQTVSGFAEVQMNLGDEIIALLARIDALEQRIATLEGPAAA